MKTIYKLTVFGNVHPKEFMPRLAQFRFSYQKNCATWRGEDCMLTVEPSSLSVKQANLKEGGEYLYRINFEGEIHTLLFYLNSFFASMSYKITACRGFVSNSEFNRSKWIAWLKQLEVKPTIIDGVFEDKKNAIGFLVHFTNELEVVIRSEKSSYLKPQSVLKIEEVIRDILPVREDLFSTHGMSV